MRDKLALSRMFYVAITASATACLERAPIPCVAEASLDFLQSGVASFNLLLPQNETPRRKGNPVPGIHFTKDDGTLIHPDTFSKHLKVLFVEIGLPKTYHMHTHRHFFISTLLHEGVDKNTVADLLVTETPLLPAVSCFLKKTPDCINADRQIQRFNDLQTSDIRLFLQKGKDVLMICI